MSAPCFQAPSDLNAVLLEALAPLARGGVLAAYERWLVEAEEAGCSPVAAAGFGADAANRGAAFSFNADDYEAALQRRECCEDYLFSEKALAALDELAGHFPGMSPEWIFEQALCAAAGALRADEEVSNPVES